MLFDDQGRDVEAGKLVCEEKADGAAADDYYVVFVGRHYGCVHILEIKEWNCDECKGSDRVFHAQIAVYMSVDGALSVSAESKH